MDFLNVLVANLVIIFSACILIHILIWGMKNFVDTKDVDVQKVEVVNFRS